SNVAVLGLERRTTARPSAATRALALLAARLRSCSPIVIPFHAARTSRRTFFPHKLSPLGHARLPGIRGDSVRSLPPRIKAEIEETDGRDHLPRGAVPGDRAGGGEDLPRPGLCAAAPRAPFTRWYARVRLSPRQRRQR